MTSKHGTITMGQLTERVLGLINHYGVDQQKILDSPYKADNVSVKGIYNTADELTGLMFVVSYPQSLFGFDKDAAQNAKLENTMTINTSMAMMYSSTVHTLRAEYAMHQVRELIKNTLYATPFADLHKFFSMYNRVAPMTDEQYHTLMTNLDGLEFVALTKDNEYHLMSATPKSAFKMVSRDVGVIGEWELEPSPIFIRGLMVPYKNVVEYFQKRHTEGNGDMMIWVRNWYFETMTALPRHRITTAVPYGDVASMIYRIKSFTL